MTLSPYETKALEEIQAYFRSPEDGLNGRVSRTLFKPVELVAERLIPDRALEVAGNAVESILKGISVVSDQTVGVNQILAEARETTGMPIVTDVLDVRDMELVARYADVLQIGARNMQHFPLLQEAGRTGLPVVSVIPPRIVMVATSSDSPSVPGLVMRCDQIVLARRACEMTVSMVSSSPPTAADLYAAVRSITTIWKPSPAISRRPTPQASSASVRPCSK